MKLSIRTIQKGIIRSFSVAVLCLLVAGTSMAQENQSGADEPANTEVQSSNDLQSTDRFDELFIRIYPNPSMGLFFIATEVKMTIQIYDRMMRPILPKTLTFLEGKHSLDLNHLESGYYIASIETDAGRQTRHLSIR